VHLSKLQMRGFKTFAERTELEFGPGITAIVGPNGVGKSNITDAILWALGEQGHKTLRTEGFQDVIFAGSEQRRPLGMAEASLVIDNTEGELPCDYSEVVLGRRLFRTGGSEYLLNRNSVRLKDIQELLVDTGLGSGAYSVIGQGEVDAIISIHCEDRRELLEQVAGVGKYRMRRTETERKLEQTQANITRVDDILYELSSQREALAEEAKVAREYQHLAEELRELELYLLADDYERRNGRRQRAQSDIVVAKADLQSTRNQISALEVEYEQTSLQVAKLTDELDSLREQAAAAERELSRRQGAEAVAAERRKAIDQRRQQLQTTRQQTQQRRQELVARQHALEQQQQKYEKIVQRQQVKAEELAAAYSQREGQYQQALEDREALYQRRTDLAGELARLDNESAALAELEEELEGRIARLTQQKQQMNERQRQAQEVLQTARERIETLQAQSQEIREQIQQIRQRHAEYVRTLRDHRHKRDLLAGAVAATESRQSLLGELQAAHEGYQEGPRALLEAAEKGHLDGIEGLVADFLEVPRRLEVAAEAGLSDRLQWVLVATEQQARQCVDYLEDKRAGRATVLAINPPPTQFAAPAAVAMGRSSDVVGVASSVLRYPQRLARVFERLLGDVVIVRDLDAAYRIRPRLTGPARLVTLDGQILGPNGEISGGQTDNAVQSTFDRRRQLRQLEKDLDDLQGYLAKMWEAEEKWEGRNQELAESGEARTTQLSETDKEISRVESEIKHVADQLRAAITAANETDQEIRDLDERRQQASSGAVESQRMQQGLRHELEELDSELKQIESEQLGREQLDRQQEKLTEAKVELAQLQEKHHSATEMYQQTQQQLRHIDQETDRVQAELQQLQAAEQEVNETLDSADDQTTHLEEEATGLRQQVEQTRQQLSALREAIGRLEAARHRLQDIREQQTEELHRSELAVARDDSQLEQIEEQLQSEYDLTPEEAVQQRPVEFKRSQPRRQAKQLRNQIRGLGYVNVGAIEQCERLQAREDFLTSQLDDLQQARADLLQVITEIDQAAQEVFLESFHQVAQAFDELFQQLFGGGHTRLELTNPDNPLAGGVDVIVQLPGRRQQNLLLLSGGEKALTALALLLAMIKVKPSPFCVMDEIDATLDAANTEQFTDVLRDFAQYTQFIIITHNPNTMEAADVLYGVTMQEPGVSKLISVELAEAQREAEQRAAQEVAAEPVAASRVSTR